MSKHYSVVEIFRTFQGEGLWSGRPAVFVRLAGCNMWNGIPADRAKGQGACAMWCDTNFAKGHPHTASEIADRIDSAWRARASELTWGGPDTSPMVVISGGEPTLQLDPALCQAISGRGYFIALETNGTNNTRALSFVDHICVSPKRGSTLQVVDAHELKVVLPGCVPGAPIEHQWSWEELRSLDKLGKWGARFVQPQDVTEQAHVERTYLHSIRNGGRPEEMPNTASLYEANVKACLDFIEATPGWRLSLQQHKYIGLR